MQPEGYVEPARVTKKGKYRREKEWDDETVDHWKIEPFGPEDNKGGPLAVESSFATLFPQYREQYLRQVCILHHSVLFYHFPKIWGQVTQVLDQFHIRCELNCTEGLFALFSSHFSLFIVPREHVCFYNSKNI